MKNVYLISNVSNGGKTYLEYLLPALNALRNNYNCVVLQTNITGLSKYEAEQVLSYPVEEVGLDYIESLKSQTIISNDAFVGSLLDESNFGVFIAHGNVGMPLRDKYYCSSLLSFWDAIVSPSRSLFGLMKTGLQLYRHDRNASRLAYVAKIQRSDLRKTSAISTLPVKLPEFLSSPPAFLRTSEQYVVGILPTQIGICPSGASLFENMEVVITAVKTQIPSAKIIVRPYMTDFENPYVKEMCEQLVKYPWISIDYAKGSSKDFYQQCDTIITDASSGGVSFMLNTCRLPIYYVPSGSESHPIVNAWLEQMDNFLPIAKNGSELKELMGGFELITPEQRHYIYKKFYESEYRDFHHPDEVFQDLVHEQHDSRFCYFAMHANGEVNERTIKGTENVLQ
ncbi:hypothetical protein [Pseudomonas purpurea]|uniref:hypothetical protein n=1 Tax=Pseudomonas purpurea TaxID=3136737 RepID=UPI003267CF47